MMNNPSSIPLTMHPDQAEALNGHNGHGTPLPLHEEDPYELVGMVLPGEAGQLEAMAEALIEEYLLLGWNAQRMMGLFFNPFYLATHRIYQQKGEAYVRQLVANVFARWGMAE